MTKILTLQAGLETLGRVSTVHANQLMLTDSESLTEIDAQVALLEPRLENLEATINAICGLQAPTVLDRLQKLRQPIGSAKGKLARIGDTLAGIKKHGLSIGNGVSMTFGALVQEGQTLFPEKIATHRPTLLFGPQGRNSGSVPDAGVQGFGPYMYMQHTRNAPLIAVLCEGQYRGRVEQFMNSLVSGFPDEHWPDANYKNPYQGGLIGKYRLTKVRLEYQECGGPTAGQYRASANKLLQRLPEAPDLVLVQIRDSFKALRGDDNPYLVSKALFMVAGVPVQAVTIEHIETPAFNLAYLLNNVALAMYAKLDGIPWVMSSRNPTTHELIIGIGSTEVGKGRLGTRERFVGITTVFQGDGRYLVWGMTREVPI